MKRIGDKISLFFSTGRQWLTAVPRYRGAVICGVSAVGAMIAIGYSGSKGVSPPSAQVVPTNGVVPAPNSATSEASLAAGNSGGSSRDTSIEPSAVNNDPQSVKRGALPTVMALDKSFLVADSKKQNPAIRDKDDAKKPAKSSAKKPQRPATSGDRDREFSPSREIQRARKTITKVIRDIF